MYYPLKHWRGALGARRACASPAGNKYRNSSTAIHGLSLVLLLISLSQLADGAWIHLKAQLAQVLIAQAWQENRSAAVHGQQSLSRAKPWPWADTWPVARLQYHGRSKQDLYVLAGAQGNSLAFGPGHLYGSALPGTTGVSIVGGHRDTHFAFLQQVKTGDRFSVTPANGELQHYIVSEAKAVDSLAEPLLAMPYASQLILVTCYPFDAVGDGSGRYVVTAELIQATEEIQL